MGFGSGSGLLARGGGVGSLLVMVSLSRPVTRQAPPFFLLQLILLLYFCQLWLTVGGSTVRLEDMLSLGLVGLEGVIALAQLRFVFAASPLNRPVLLLIGVILLSIVVTLVQPFAAVVKKDALVNGLRLALAVGLFFLVYFHPAPAGTKAKAIFQTILLFSLVTTAVALWQIVYWEGWLPVSLPPVLRTFKPGANTFSGREIFSLFIGNTGTHVWSAMLAMQALGAWIIASNSRNVWYRLAGFGYWGLLTLILFRTTVRNSLLGLVIAIVGLGLLKAWHSQDGWNGLLKMWLIVVLPILTLLALFTLAPDAFFVARLRSVFPQLANGQWVIDTNSNLYGRLYTWWEAWLIFVHRPVLGGGFWSYATLSPIYGIATFVHAHNSYLQILAEWGTIGWLAFCWFVWRLRNYLSYVWQTLPGRSLYHLTWEWVVASALFLAFTAFFGNPLWEPNQVGFFMALLGALMSFSQENAIRKAIAN